MNRKSDIQYLTLVTLKKNKKNNNKPQRSPGSYVSLTHARIVLHIDNSTYTINHTMTSKNIKTTDS